MCFTEWEEIKCTDMIPVIEPPVTHRAKDYKKPKPRMCGRRYVLRLTFWRRRKYWKDVQVDYLL